MQDPCCAHHLRVLLIEDNCADAQLVRALLADAENSGVTFDVALVTGLDAAREALRRCRFDAVLLDLGLPDAAGTDLIEIVHTAAPEAAIIVSSGQAADDCLLAQAIIRKGAEDFLPKDGLTAALVARTITTAVERRQSTTAIRARTHQLEAALTYARIGHLSWIPERPEAVVAGDFPRLLDPAITGPHLSMRRFLRRLPEPGRRCLYAAWQELRTGADQLAVVLVEHDRSSRSRGHDLLLDIVVQRDAGGRIVRLDALLRDTAMVGHVERLEGEMLTHLGHELRTPLTAIRGTLGLLAHEADASSNDAALTLLENAIANAERISRVIGHTLGSKADHPSKLRCQPRRVALGRHLCDALAARLPGSARAGGGPSLTVTSTGRSLDVLVDAARLRRAVDCVCARLLASGGRADRLTLDVSLKGDIAWLKLAPAEAGRGEIAGRRAETSDGARSRSAPAGLCIAVPLAC